jgi:hypothetical protein
MVGIQLAFAPAALSAAITIGAVIAAPLAPSAQVSGAASIEGKTRDSSGAVLPGVTTAVSLHHGLPGS